MITAHAYKTKGKWLVEIRTVVGIVNELITQKDGLTMREVRKFVAEHNATPWNF